MPRPMKQSGVEWLGDIPADWDVVNIRKLFSFGKGLPITKEDLRESGLPVISYGQIHSKFNSGTTITSELIRFVDDDYLQSYSQSLVKCGDFIFADTSEDLAGCGNCVYVDTDERIFAGYHTIILRNKTCSQMKYFAFLFQSDAWRKQIRERVTGVKLFSISQKILRATSVIIPPPDEQQRIASFLDDKCARIDSVIEKTRASVEEYKKLKQAIITRAVTKGIRPNRTLKHSGIEWLGDIPADWKIGRVSRFFDIQLGKMLQPEANDANDTLENYLCAANLGGNKLKLDTLRQMWFSTSDKKKFDVRKGDLLVVEGGDVASCDIVNEDIQGVYIQNALHRVRSSTGFDVRLLRYLLIIAKAQGHIDLICNKATIAHFTKEKFASIPFPVPPPDEQKEIANYLDEKTAAIDSLIEKKGRLVTELERLKKSLIFEYVTGKKEALEKA